MVNKITPLFICLFTAVGLFGQTTVKRIRPGDTNSLIATFNADSHYVYLNTTVAAKNVLVVHLPGSFGEPKRSTLFGTLAADLGFHSIGLMYPNAPTVASFCANTSDLLCYENVRREIVEGIDYSSSISIGANEGILSRLNKLLIYLHANFPTENWGQYLDANNNLVYNKLIFSGHSQGGGHAALIAKFYPIKRALCFSSPKDWSNYYNRPPGWLSPAAWQTTPESIYCFNHVLDEHTRQLEIWDSLGVDNYGAPVNVDVNASPYSTTRQLTTTYAVPIGDEHSSTIQDNKTPKVAGVPVFLPVWTYMLTNNTTTGTMAHTAYLNVRPNPNPASGVVNLELESDQYTITVFNQTGACVLQQQATTGTIQLNLTNVDAGVYFVNARGSRHTFKARFVKQ